MKPIVLEIFFFALKLEHIWSLIAVDQSIITIFGLSSEADLDSNKFTLVRLDLADLVYTKEMTHSRSMNL